MKYKTANKAISLLLTLCMLVGMLPTMSISAAAADEHSGHSDWTALTASDMALESGNYYLNGDVTLTSSMLWIQGGKNVTLCLNGNILAGKSGGNCPVFLVEDGATLTICDCGTQPHEGYIGADGLWKAGTGEGTKCDLTGGVITGGNDSVYGGGGIYNNGTVTITGGNIAGNATTSQGGGVYNYGGSTLNISDCTIVGNTAAINGGGVFNNSGTLNLSGTVKISDNLAYGTKINLFLNRSLATVNGTLTDASCVGVTMASAGNFAQPDGTVVTTLEGMVGRFFSDSADYEVVESGTALALQKRTINFTVSFDANGGDGEKDDVTATSVTYTLPGNPFTAPEGQEFAGWATSADGDVISGTTYVLSGDTTFYAIWRDKTEVTGVTVTPGTVSVGGGKTQQFSATVNGTGSLDQSVTWSVDGGYYNTTKIDETGLLSVALYEPAGTLTVTATSKTDSSKFGTATVTVVPILPGHGADNAHTPEYGADTTSWKAVTQTNINDGTWSTGNGKYYLEEDIELDSTLELQNVYVFCLNGHSIRLKESATGPVIRIWYGRSVYNYNVFICDCCPEAHAENPTYGYWTKASEGNYQYLLTEDSSEVSDEVMPHDTITGGYIAGGNGNNGCGVHVSNAVSSLRQVYFENCAIVGNVNADHGGGIMAEQIPVTLNNTKLIGNQSLYAEVYSNVHGGGGIYAGGSETTLTVNDGSVISHNIAYSHGGGIAAYNGVQLNGNVTIEGNITFGGDGGGVRARTIKATAGEDNAITISGNQACDGGNGGGLAANSYYLNALQLDGVKLENNQAGGNGGGVYLYSEESGYKGTSGSELKDCSILNNTAAKDGGGLYIQAYPTNAYTIALDTTTVSGNSARSGGGVYYRGGDGRGTSNVYQEYRYLMLNAGTSITGNSASQQAGGVKLEDYGAQLYFNGGTVSGNTLTGSSTDSNIVLCGGAKDRSDYYLPQLIFGTNFDKNTPVTLGVSVDAGMFDSYPWRDYKNQFYRFYGGTSANNLPSNVTIQNEGEDVILTYLGSYDKRLYFTCPKLTVNFNDREGLIAYAADIDNFGGTDIPVTFQWYRWKQGEPQLVTEENVDEAYGSYAENQWSLQILDYGTGAAYSEDSIVRLLCDAFSIELEAGETISFQTPDSLLNYGITSEGVTYYPPYLGGPAFMPFTYTREGDTLTWTATAPETGCYDLILFLYGSDSDALISYANALKLSQVQKVSYTPDEEISPINYPYGNQPLSKLLFLTQMDKDVRYAAKVVVSQPTQERKENNETVPTQKSKEFWSEIIVGEPMIYVKNASATYQQDKYKTDVSAMYFLFDPMPGTEDVTVQYRDEEGEWATKAENEDLTLTKTPLSEILDEWGIPQGENAWRTFYNQVLTDYDTVQLPLDGSYDAGSYRLLITAKDGDKTVSSEDMPYTPGLYIYTADSELEDVDGGKILSGIPSTYTVTLPDDGYTYAQKGSLPTGVQSATVSGNILTIVTTDGVPEGAFTLKFTASKKNYNDCTLTVNLTGVRLPDAAITISGLTESETYDGQAVSVSASSTEDPTMTYTYTWQENTGTADSPVWTSLTQAPKDVGSYRLMVTGVSSTHMGSATQAFAIVPKALTWDTSDLSAAKPQNSAAEANVYGELKVTGLVSGDGVSFTSPSGMTTNGLSGTEQTVGEHADTPLKLADDAAWSSLTLTGTGTANYTMPTGAPTITAVVNKVEGKTESDPLPTPPESADNKQLKLEMEHGISDVPGALASNPGLNTPTKIVDKMTESIQTENTSIAEENTAVYEVTLLVSTDSGASWTEATAANFPAEGLTVTLPYPEGTNSSYRFTVVHMFTEGESAGTVEYPVVTNTAEGIQFKVTSLSPIAVGWTAPISSGGGGGVSTYSISLPSNIPNGKLTSDRKTASKGTTVTLTATPDDGYTLDTLTVTDKDGKQLTLTNKGNGKYTFTMPAGKVTISVSFVKSGEAPCGKVDCPVGRFTDTSVTAWYHDGIHYCVEKGMMSGVGGNAFAPNAISSRAMIATMLWQLEGAPVVNDTLNYEDTVEGVWYTEAVRWAVSKGILQGYGNGKFGPNDDVTREQMVTILLSYAKYKGYDVSVGEDTNILSFGDATTVAEYAIPAMQWACGSGIVGGKDAADGSGLILDPKGSTTRAEMATMMMRFCAEIVK